VLFQQFLRFGYQGIPNTLEIRGRTPKLYVERVGGSVFDFTAGLGQPPQVPFTGNKFDAAPTIWESFPCVYDSTATDAKFGQYVCQVSRPQVRNISPKNSVPIYADVNQVDNNPGYCPNGRVAIAVEGAVGVAAVSWSGVPLKGNLGDEPTVADHTDVLTKGLVQVSHRSGEDLYSVHTHNHCSTVSDIVHGVIEVIGCILSCDLGN